MRVPHTLLRDVITVEDFLGSGAMGPTFSAPHQVRASVQSTGQLLPDSQGRVATVMSHVIIRPEAGPVALESRVTFQDAKYRVVESYPMPDSRRPTQYELKIAQWAST